MTNRPILIFDVNETLLDLETLTPHFERIFGDGRVMREWFAQVILYSEALTLSGGYADFGALGGSVLRMLGEIKGRAITAEDSVAVKEAVAAMPPHPDVATALQSLSEAGFRMTTLTNNPNETARKQLERGHLAKYFERMFSIDDRVRRYKPAREIYHWVADELGVPTSECCLIACHMWDILGAAATGMQTAMVLRSGNSTLDVGPKPNIVGRDISEVAAALIGHSN